jgi:hypothetical protein
MAHRALPEPGVYRFDFLSRVMPMYQKKSDTKWYHSTHKTRQGAQVDLQRCPIPLIGKSNTILS